MPEPYFDSLQAFFAMGTHGKYVWLSYGIALVIIFWNLISLKMARTQSLAALRRHWSRQEGAEVDQDQPSASDTHQPDT